MFWRVVIHHCLTGLLNGVVGNFSLSGFFFATWTKRFANPYDPKKTNFHRWLVTIKLYMINMSIASKLRTLHLSCSHSILFLMRIEICVIHWTKIISHNDDQFSFMWVYVKLGFNSKESRTKLFNVKGELFVFFEKTTIVNTN